MNTAHERGPHRLEVVAGVLTDEQGRVLITRRPAGKPMAGRWEFPGGKRKSGESLQQALSRELTEELGVTPMRAEPLIRFAHRYPDRAVQLDFFRVTAWEGHARGLENQDLAWVAPEDLNRWDILEADRPVIQALRLPGHVLVTPFHLTPELLEERLPRILANGVRMVQFRVEGEGDARWLAMARRAAELCGGSGARLIINADPALVDRVGAHGVHLSARRLMDLSARPLPASRWTGASCHSAEALQHAVSLQLDYAFLGPVRVTETHPGAEPLGLDRFASLVASLALPVYGIGGMRPADVDEIRQRGGQGIAAIRAFWEDDPTA
ncbi:MAG: Nudix family hydrolase [Gammaproteobacteria bacterium]